MQPEQQQRIMGYFIEEAKDHLNTIEQGLLSLQSTIEDTEMMNEVFRAAHSVKGGAGMLGINSIHKTAHRLEDYLKFLQESPVKVDSKLETLFLQVFDTLEGLVEQLQSPFGLTEETASGMMSDATPVFEQLNTHLEQLIRKTVRATIVGNKAPKAAHGLDEAVLQSVNVQSSGKDANVLPATFKRDVLLQLREMLQIFKQQDLPEHREQLQAHCRSLESIGEAVLPGWSELLETSRLAIASSNNSYRQLAGLVIKEIKQAQELALANRSVEIAPSAQLKAMVPVSQLELEPIEPLESSATDIEQDRASNNNGNISATTSQNSSESSVLEAPYAQDIDLTPDYYTNRSTYAEGATSQASEMSDPEVGIAELNSLADIFEGQTPDLDQTWQEEEVINLNEPDANNSLEDLSLDDSGDLNNFEFTTTQTANSEELSDWVEDETTNQKSSPPLPSTSTSTNNTRQNLDSDFSDLLFESDSPGQRLIGNTEADELNNLFGDSFFEENQEAETFADFEFDEQGMLLSSDTGEAETFADFEFDEQGMLLSSDTGIDETHSNGLDNTNQDDLFAFTNQDSDNDVALEDFSSEQSLFEALEITPPSELNNDLLEFSTSSTAPEEELWFGEEAADFSLEELSFDDADNLDLSGSSDDFNLEDLLNTQSQPTVDDAESVLFFEDEPETDTSALNLEIDELWSLAEPENLSSEANGDNLEALIDNFEVEDSSTDLFDFEQEDNASTDDLLAPQLSAQAAAFDQNNFDELFPQTTETTDLDALTFEGIDLESLEETEISDLDAFNNFFDDAAAEPEGLESLSEFDDFALIDQATTNSDEEVTAENGHSELLPQQEIPEAAELDVEATEEEIDLSEFLFESADTAQTEQVAVDDLDTLLEAEELDFEDDLLAQEALPQVENTETTNLDSLLETADATVTPVDEEWADDVDDLFNWDTTESSDDGLNEATAASADWELESAQETASQNSEFDDLEDLLAESQVLPAPMSSNQDNFSEFDDLEALLGESSQNVISTNTDLEGFDDLDALLNLETPASTKAPTAAQSNLPAASVDDFGDLEQLLEQAYKTMGGPPKPAPVQGQPKATSRPRPRVFEQTMRVPVKHLDSLSNLVGELVVNRNSLEQDQERLRQFLDNLSHQVLALSDVGSRMQDLYERSLLESSLLASRHPYRIQTNNFLPASSSNFESSSNSDGVEYDPLEMDRFTGFHLLSQEMIELIVRVRESASDIEFLVDETDQVARMLRQVTTQLQEGLTRSRMVPFAQTADRLPRAVRDISQKLRKEAQLYVEGRETLIDKMILEHLSDPMTHLINNALTHGIELPEIRRAAGKSATGKITLKAFHQGNQTVISVSDDGAGIDPERVRAKAVECRLISAEDAKTLTNLDLYNFLFHPGFTTKDKEDEYAGRGVGMDVVLTSMSEIRGTVHVDSTLGKGTTFTIRLPLTLSICKALCCLSDRARIAFPMDGVEDMLDIPSDRVQLNSEGQTCIKWREALLPFQSLSQLLKYNRQLSRGTVYGGKREDDMISIVVLRSAGNFIAIQVDQVLGEQEIVIKQLEGPAPKPVGIAGATVLGDGRIMPIADVLELIDLAMGRIRKDNVNTLWSHGEQDGLPEEPHITKTEPLVLIVDDSITVRELLSMTFNKSGYRVEQARDGQEAWDKLRSGLPCDIVFCDIEMPRMDGLELLSRLQKDETLCNLPIAMLTSRGADRHRQMASQLGANGYFTKPYLEEVLLEAAQRMIKGEVLFGSNSTSNA